MDTITRAATAKITRPYAAVATDPGVKSHSFGNADAVDVAESQDSWLYMVADGVGKAPGSKQASQIAVTELKEYLLTHPPAEGSDDCLRETLKSAFEEANVAELNADTYTENSSTTLVAVLIHSSGRACFGNVGDSRAYILRNGQLRQITVDHSWIEEQVTAGKMTRAEAARYPRESKIIYRSVGKHPRLEPDFFLEQLQPGDTVLLCSDGLYRMVAKDVGEDDDTALPVKQRIVDTIGKYSATKLDKAASELVRIANSAGGEDNISVILARIPASIDGTAAAGGAVVAGNKGPPHTIRLLVLGVVLVLLFMSVGILVLHDGDPETAPATVVVVTVPGSPTSILSTPTPLSITAVIIVVSTPVATSEVNLTPLPALRAVKPEQGSVIYGLATPVVLSWEDDIPLGRGEDYVVRFRFSGGLDDGTAIEVKAADTNYTMSAGYYNRANTIYWQVQREKDGVPLGDSSNTGYFSWLAPLATMTTSPLATLVPTPTALFAMPTFTSASRVPTSGALATATPPVLQPTVPPFVYPTRRPHATMTLRAHTTATAARSASPTSVVMVHPTQQSVLTPTRLPRVTDTPVPVPTNTSIPATDTPGPTATVGLPENIEAQGTVYNASYGK